MCNEKVTEVKKEIKQPDGVRLENHRNKLHVDLPFGMSGGCHDT